MSKAQADETVEETVDETTANSEPELTAAPDTQKGDSSEQEAPAPNIAKGREANEEVDVPKKPKRQPSAPDPADVTVNPASFADLHPQPNGRKEKASLDMLLDIGLQITVELGRTKMNIRDVLSVGPGTVVELNRVAGEPVDILINGKPIAKGEVVVIGDMFGVRVTDILPPAQRVQSMI
ncbi:MAG: flagellar motor switch protein FliN [Caldilineaceae bacterium]|nr:flagellar motor switch protein FliN [Caldilineaceae bacterium]